MEQGVKAMDDARRRFLKAIVISGAASSPLLTGQGVPAADAVVAPKHQTGEAVGSMPAPRKAVLIVSAEGGPKQAITSHLNLTYQLRVASRAAVRELSADRGRSVAIRTLFRSLDAIVHVPDQSDQSVLPQRIDDCTRVTYSLLQAAVQEGVRQVVYLSSLAMMVGYDEAFQVDEDWPPIPGDSLGLAEYLGEYVCREFAREGKLSV